MPTSAAEGLRFTNDKLRVVIGRWQSDPIDASAIQPHVLHELLADLKQAAELLRGVVPGAPGADLGKEISEYRGNVQQIGQLLPAIQGRMLAEKARLESIRAHLEAAASWSEARKKTL